MSQVKKYPFAYAAALAALAALGLFFLPVFSVGTVEGTSLFIFGFVAAFGGNVYAEIGGSVYSLTFSTNIFALVLLMCLLLSSVAALLSKESTINRIAAALLSIAGAVLVFLLPHRVGQAGLQLGYGAYLCIGFALLSAIFDILALFIRPKKA